MIVSLPSRSQLLAWIGQLTNKNVQKIEHLSDGLLFCELFDKIYPKYINFHKLKRDPRIPLEKEKNFKILLNAINQLGLCVRINIVDLSHGKITALLELLQWFYKEYKNPSGKANQNDEINLPFNEPRMIKSYVGNLVIRQKSCQKEANSESSHLRQSRRSLDSKMIQDNILQSEGKKTVKSKSIQKTQNKENSKSKGNSSKIKRITFNEEGFKKSCQRKRSELKKMYDQKGSKNKNQTKEEETDESIRQFLRNAFNFGYPNLSQLLIPVTEQTLDNNPELKEKIKMLMENPRQPVDNKKNFNQTHESKFRNIFASNRRTSQEGQNDTVESIIEVEQNSQQSPKFNKMEIQINQIDMKLNPNERQNPIPHQFSQKKQLESNKKETVKKSLVKSGKSNSKPLFQSLTPISQKWIPQAKQHPEREGTLSSVYDEVESKNPNNNQMLFKKNNIFSKPLNPEIYVTEKKIESKNQIQNDNPREVQSEKQQENVDDSVWKSKICFFDPYPKLP